MERIGVALPGAGIAGGNDFDKHVKVVHPRVLLFTTKE
jgi:hypothetical protein